MMTINASPETKDPNGDLHSPNGVRFKSKPDGLTRVIISNLLKERDEKKALRNTFKNGSPEYELYDMQQNVLKVIMNTYYGVSGYPKFRLFDHDIGGAVTSTGRALIEHSKKVIEQCGYKVAYGDSVTKRTIIDIGYKSVFIEDLFTHVDTITDDGKEYCLLHNIKSRTYSANNEVILNNIKYVMRHKCNKQVYRVICDNGDYVDVTEDHSLIAINTKTNTVYEIKPTDIIIGVTDLIHKWIGILKAKKVYPIDYHDYVYDIEVEDTHRFFGLNECEK